MLNSNHRGTGRGKTAGDLGERVPRVPRGIPNSDFFFNFSIYKKLNGQKKIRSLLLAKKKIGSLKKTSFENFVIGSQCGGFQFMLILDLWGISFHPAVVVGLGNDLLFNSSVGHCATFMLKNQRNWLKQV